LGRYVSGLFREMKQRNSKTESELLSQFTRNQVYLEPNSNLSNYLQLLGHSIEKARLIDVFTEQSSLVFTVLLNKEEVLKVEISNRDESENEVLESFSLKEFKFGLSQINQIKLAVGLGEICGKT
jgi:hypothetical protein